MCKERLVTRYLWNSEQTESQQHICFQKWWWICTIPRSQGKILFFQIKSSIFLSFSVDKAEKQVAFFFSKNGNGTFITTSMMRERETMRTEWGERGKDCISIAKKNTIKTINIKDMISMRVGKDDSKTMKNQETILRAEKKNKQVKYFRRYMKHIEGGCNKRCFSWNNMVLFLFCVCLCCVEPFYIIRGGNAAEIFTNDSRGKKRLVVSGIYFLTFTHTKETFIQKQMFNKQTFQKGCGSHGFSP